MARHYLQTVRAAAHDSAAVVTRLREFGRRREVKDVFLPLNLPRLVQEAATFTQPKWRNQARATGRTVNVRLELSPLPDVAGNAEELREVVANLIFNAVDAMPQGGDITLRTRRAGDGAVAFEVADTGVGMSEEVHRRCLEPFFTTKSETGAGMGLSVAYGIIKRHEGNLDILTQLGHGTTVFVRLPVAPAVTAGGGTLAAPGAKPDRPLRVLLVEDDARVREVVGEYLRRDQHEVCVAESAREGLEKFDAGRFDLVVTDLALEEMNGEQLAAAIKGRAAKCPGDPADRFRRHPARPRGKAVRSSTRSCANRSCPAICGGRWRRSRSRPSRKTQASGEGPARCSRPAAGRRFVGRIFEHGTRAPVESIRLR